MQLLILAVFADELQELDVVDGREVVVEKLLDAVLIVDHGDAVHGDEEAALLQQTSTVLSVDVVQLSQRLLQTAQARLSLGENGRAQVADQEDVAQLMMSGAAAAGRRQSDRCRRRRRHGMGAAAVDAIASQVLFATSGMIAMHSCSLSKH